MRTIWAVALLAWAGACAGVPGAQPFSDAETQRRSYPAEHYVVGVGEGPTMEIARRKAAVEISSQLSGSLHAEGWVEAESERTERGAFDRERVGETIHVETELARMEWVEVVSARTRGETVEVVAVLDRRKAGQRLRSELDERAESIRAGLERALQNSGLLAKAKALHLLEKERASLRASLRLLGALTPGPTWSPPVIRDLDRALGELHAHLREVEWELCLEIEEAPELASVFAGRLGERGVYARDCGAPPSGRNRFLLRGRLAASVQKMDNPGGYPFFCATRLLYRIEGDEEAMEAGGIAEGLRTGARAMAEACARSVEGLADEFLQRIGWEPGASP